MQLELFDTPKVGTYVAPKPKAPTALESLKLRPLLDRFAPLVEPSPLLESPWRWTKDGQQWSAVVNRWLLLAVHGYNTEAAPLGDVLIGNSKLRNYVELQQPPEAASRITFAKLREWAGPTRWPFACHPCGGADCPTCEGRKRVMETREKQLEKTAIDANLVGCALETLAPAVAPGQNLWMWRDENGGRPALRFESRDWRLIVMARTKEASQKNVEK